MTQEDNKKGVSEGGNTRITPLNTYIPTQTPREKALTELSQTLTGEQRELLIRYIKEVQKEYDSVLKSANKKQFHSH